MSIGLPVWNLCTHKFFKILHGISYPRPIFCRFWGQMTPKIHSGKNLTPKRHYLESERSVWAIKHSDRSICLGCGCVEEKKTEKKEKNGNRHKKGYPPAKKPLNRFEPNLACELESWLWWWVPNFIRLGHVVPELWGSVFLAFPFEKHMAYNTALHYRAGCDTIAFRCLLHSFSNFEMSNLISNVLCFAL